jgi:hypothetical protein
MNGNGKQDDIEKLLAEQRAILEAPHEEQLAQLRDYVFKSLGTIFAGLRNIRARLPLAPWLVKTVGSIGLMSLLGAFGWLIRMDARACTARDEAHEAKVLAVENYEKLDDRLRPTENGIVKLLADMDNLRAARGVKPSTRMQQYRVRRQLGLAHDTLPPDSTAGDTTGQ